MFNLKAVYDNGLYMVACGRFTFGIWQTPLSWATYIYLIYTIDQLRVKGLAQGPSSGGWWYHVVNSQPSWSVVQHLNHWASKSPRALVKMLYKQSYKH